MPAFRDQLGSIISLPRLPQRIVSLVPSQSEYLWDLGVRPAGITKFCIHPSAMYHSVARVGGTKNLDIGKIRELKPDLIIGNREENDEGQIRELRKEFPVWMSDIYSLEDAFDMMRSIATVTGKEAEGREMLEDIKNSLSPVRDLFKSLPVLYFIWNRPYMVAASHTFISSVMEHAGLVNSASQWKRYPDLSIGQLVALQPELCFLSTEPFPFAHKHVEELRTILPGAKVFIVDGEMFSWYGSRMRLLPAYLLKLRSEIDARQE